MCLLMGVVPGVERRMRMHAWGNEREISVCGLDSS